MSHDAHGSGSAPGFGNAEALQGMPFGLGSVIARKYRVERILGAGGMGVVVAGTPLGTERRVAIKVMRPTAAESEEFIVRFSREARATAQMQSEHVTRVIDVGAMEGGLPFMVMELLEGADLSRVLRERGPLDVASAAEFTVQACQALSEAHGIGIVHRDLKPANLFLCRRPDGSPLVKVLDFGISKLSGLGEDDLGGDGLTKTQAMMGSPHYMSPEQLRSPRGVDARADLWSLGAVLFRLLTNETPFAAESTAELCVAILVGTPKSLRELRPDVPPALEAVVMRCLAKNPAERYASAAELAQALAPFVAFESPRTPRVGGVTPAPPVALAYGPPGLQEATRALPNSSAYPGYGSQSTLTSSSSSLKPQPARAPLSESAKVALVVTGFLFVVGASVFAAVLAKGNNARSAATTTASAPVMAPMTGPTSPPAVVTTRAPANVPPVIELGDAKPGDAGTAHTRPAPQPAPAAQPQATAARPRPTGGSTAPARTSTGASPAPKPTADLPDFGGRK